MIISGASFLRTQRIVDFAISCGNLKKGGRLRCYLDVDVFHGGSVSILNANGKPQFLIEAHASRTASLVRCFPHVACTSVDRCRPCGLASNVRTVRAWILIVKRVLRSG